jgi:hypothetical protein
MNGLLQRLAGQALGATSRGGSGTSTRIRSAASVHRHAPLGFAPREHTNSPAAVRTPELARPEPAIDARAPDRDAEPPASVARTTPVSLASRPMPMPESAMPATRAAMQPDSSPVDTPREAELRSVASVAPARLLQEVADARADGVDIAARLAEPRLQVNAPGGAAARTPTEVHVHIGRIEVTAASDAAAPKKPRAPASRPTRDLSDYLLRGRT